MNNKRAIILHNKYMIHLAYVILFQKPIFSKQKRIEHDQLRDDFYWLFFKLYPDFKKVRLRVKSVHRGNYLFYIEDV